MRLVVIFCLCVSFSLTFAEEPFILPGKLNSSQSDLSAYSWFYEDISGDTLPLSVIKNKSFYPFSQKRNERNSVSQRSVMITWLRFTIHNSHPLDTLKLFHRVGMHNTITTFLDSRIINKVGHSIPGSLSKTGRKQRPFRNETLLEIPPAATHTYYVRVLDFQAVVLPVLSQVISSEANTDMNYEEAVLQYPLLAVMSLLLGSLLFMALYALYNFFLARDSVYLFYFLYLISSSLICFHSMDNRFGLNVLFPYYKTLNPYYPSYLHPSVIAIFYSYFIVKILELRLQSGIKGGIFKVLLAILFIQELISLIDTIRGWPVFENNVMYAYGLLPSGLTTAFLIAMTLKSRSPIRGYVLAGMLSLLCFSMFPMLVNFNIGELPRQIDSFVNLLPLWLLFGLSLEAFFFILALSYRGRLIELEKRGIQERYARELQTQLENRTKEIQEQNRQLEAQRLQQIESEFDRKLADSEMVALRSQMNPHFIFNCLNSIKLYTLQNNSDQASEYLTKFSRLIRLVLENSRSEMIQLCFELEALQLYIELEAMRFKQKLKFAINISADVDTKYLKIPPLLLQPYVENAIWHGLMQRPEGGEVTIGVSQPDENLLRIEITDNGIGRAMAAQLKSKSAGGQKSFGLQVTADRIRMINQLYNTYAQTQIFDLADTFGKACGTKVVIEIPV